jgi:D-alanyl-D-alanine carboxypeptidase/D-alanyl-D-alanine-endopeptidase (penicillin-binding protein 4)
MAAPTLVTPRRRAAVGRFIVAVLALTSVTGGLLAGAPRATAVEGAIADGPAAEQASTEGTAAPTTPLLSARRIPGLVGDAVARDRLAAVTGEIVATAPPATCALVADDRGVITGFGTDAALVPASTMKLATASVALEVLGPDHRWTTSVAVGAPIVDGVVAGDLVVVGGGDPLLVTSGFAAGLPGAATRATTSFEALADAVVAAGVRRVEGAVLGDDSRFDAQRSVPTWSPSYLDGATVGSLGALRVNRGLTDWTEAPERRGGRGNAGDPAPLAAATFATLLRQRGVEVVGGSGGGVVPAGAQTVASIVSPPLTDVVTEILSWSDNGAAELVLKELGLVGGGGPTTPAGAAVVTATLAGWGLPLDGFVMTDGSGLDVNNRVTCPLLVGLMRRVTSVPDLVTRLAVAGQVGTLTGRLGAEQTAGWVWAKTGSLYGVTSLAGVTLSADGRAVYFAWVANGARTDPGLATALPDAFVTTLRGYPDAPPPAELGPRPAAAPAVVPDPAGP